MRVPDLGEGRQTPEQAEGRVGRQGSRGTVRRNAENVGLVTGTERSSRLGRNGIRILAGHHQRTEFLRILYSGGISRPATNHKTLVVIILDVAEGTSDSRLEIAGVRTLDLDFESRREHQPSRSGGD